MFISSNIILTPHAFIFGLLLNNKTLFSEEKMAYSYRWKLRVPMLRRKDKIFNFQLVLPFKSRRFISGR